MKVFFAVTFALLCGIAIAQQIPVKKATIYSNGLSHITRTGKIKVNNNEVAIQAPSSVVYGTFYVVSSPENPIKMVRVFKDTIKVKTKANTVAEFIQANVNRPVTLSFSPVKMVDKSITGRVKEFDPSTGKIRFITDAGRTTIMDVKHIYAADYKDEPSAHYFDDVEKIMLAIQLNKPSAETELHQSYITKGFNWSPAYHFRIQNADSAILELKATIENNVEDLTDVELELVIGAPNLLYNEVEDPVTFPGDLPGSNFKTMYGANAYAQSIQRSVSPESSVPGYADTDLYIYKSGKNSLSKNSKLLIPLTSGAVSYTDKYICTIGDYQSGYHNTFIPVNKKAEAVKHFIEFTNTSDVPYPKSVVTCISQQGQVLAVSQLEHTAPGAKATVEISKTLDVLVTCNELEKSRDKIIISDGKQPSGSSVIEGEIIAENHQQKDVTLNITKSISGTVQKLSDNATFETKYVQHSNNPSSEIRWVVTLKPSEKKTLSYVYETEHSN